MTYTINEEFLLRRLEHYIEQNNKLIVAGKQMREALWRLANRANTLGQKRQIARDALAIDPDIAKLLDDYIVEDDNDKPSLS